jgi:hypothetical protein
MLFPCLADSPPGARRRSARSQQIWCRVLRVFLHACVSIRFVPCFWLLGVCRTVREEGADSRFCVDCPRVGHRQSIFQGAVLEVWGLFSEGMPLCLQTVCQGLADGPPRARGWSARSLAQLLSLLLLDLRFLLGIV